MSFRSILLIPIANDGVRIKSGILGIRNEKIYALQESIINEIIKCFENTPINEWSEKVTPEFVQGLLPDIKTRKGDIDFLLLTDKDGQEKMLIRCFISFSVFKLGGWILHEGVKFNSDGKLVRFTNEELAEYW